jgi:hypothetical protein
VVFEAKDATLKLISEFGIIAANSHICCILTISIYGKEVGV